MVGCLINKSIFNLTQLYKMKNIQDEFQIFREELKKLKIDVKKIVKVGNGSMDFHEVFYKSPRYDDVKTVYVQRHNLDNLIEKFKEVYP